jgi:hypothetical protein
VTPLSLFWVSDWKCSSFSDLFCVRETGGFFSSPSPSHFQ